MRIHGKMLGIYIIILAGIIGYIGFTLEDSNILVFGIPDPRTYQLTPLSLQNPIPIDTISCYLKTKLFVLGTDEQLITLSSSPFLGDVKNDPDNFGGVNPLLSTVVKGDPRDQEADYFQVWGFLRCPQDIFLDQIPLRVDKSAVELRVTSQNSEGNNVLTHQSKINTIEVLLGDNTEKQIFRFNPVKFSDILSKLDSGRYDSKNVFDVTGTIIMHWENAVDFIINYSNITTN